MGDEKVALDEDGFLRCWRWREGVGGGMGGMYIAFTSRENAAVPFLSLYSC